MKDFIIKSARPIHRPWKQSVRKILYDTKLSFWKKHKEEVLEKYKAEANKSRKAEKSIGFLPVFEKDAEGRGEVSWSDHQSDAS